MSYELPALLTELARVIGLPAAIKLSKQLGGTRVFVPKPRALHPEHRLVTVLGFKLARALASARSGEWISVPRGVAILRRARDLEIVRRYDAGESSHDLAREFELTERAIWKIAASEELAKIEAENAASGAAPAPDVQPAKGASHRAGARARGGARRGQADDRQLALPWLR